MSTYPQVLSEDKTLDCALAGGSISRIGDGELRLCTDGKSISQDPDPKLAQEMRQLIKGSSASLVCIPNAMAKTRKPVMWGRYSVPKYSALYDMNKLYGSSFITRPDSSPWIDRDEYWRKWCQLWEGRDVTLVIGTRGGSFTHLVRAKSVRLIYGPERDAYSAIDQLEYAVGVPPKSSPVMICLGAAATVLAERLARRGAWALDLGHLGRFMPQKYLQP